MTENNKFIVAQKGSAIRIYLDPKGNDYDGLSLVGTSFVRDIELLSDAKAEIVNQVNSSYEYLVVAGTIGENDQIDRWIEEGKLLVKDMQGKRECYKIVVLEQPTAEIQKALVIVGSEKRGTIYGIYSVSESMGISPWVYWGDVKPKKKPTISFTYEEISKTSKEPSVKYRGFFMNDEWPSLGNWVENTFGDFNDNFYGKVFELLLRLKGNYLWPAMWSASFSLDGDKDGMANVKLAQAYGVIMGTSHHEPLMRASEEWDKVKTQSNDEGYGKDWNYFTNERGLRDYWSDGVQRNKQYDNIITLGMRGERDSSMLGDFSGLKENVEFLKKVITDQKKILRDHDIQDAPLMLALYKEVEDYYYGSKEVEGLNKWSELDDVLLLLSEDNFGNVRIMPTPENRDREAGWGIYYHFDYHGGPVSYEWVNSTPLNKTWEQMSMAYDYGIQDLWIVNVGDVRPQELPLSYFMELAYDFDTWGSSAINKTEEFLLQWTKQQFGDWVSEDKITAIAEVLEDYTRMNGKVRPEHLQEDTFDLLYYREAEKELQAAIALEEKAKSLYQEMPVESKDAYYGLVYYPAVASANLRKMMIYAAQNHLQSKRGSSLANTYAKLTQQCIEYDKELTFFYNEEMSEGKWKGMMSSAHVGFKSWDAQGWAYPEVELVTLQQAAKMLVAVPEKEDACAVGDSKLPILTNLEKDCYAVELSNAGKESYTYEVTTDCAWIQVSKKEGVVEVSDSFYVTIDVDQCGESQKGFITIKGTDSEVKILVESKGINTKAKEMTFVQSKNYISIEAEHFSKNVKTKQAEWKVIRQYGRSLSSIKMYPSMVSFTDPTDAPFLEYQIEVLEDAEYQLRTYLAPTNNLSEEKVLRYAIGMDEETPMILNALSEKFVAGSGYSKEWSKGVMRNIREKESRHHLTKGTHVLRFYGLDAGVVLQKLVLYSGKLPNTFYGPEESYFVQREN